MTNLDKQINKINLMPSNKEKAIDIAKIISYVGFLIESKQINENKAYYYLSQINEMDFEIKHLIHAEKKAASNLVYATDILNSLYKNILTYANNYNLFFPELPKVNISKLFEYAKDFLYFIDKEALNLFNRLIDNDLVYESDLDTHGGTCYKLDGNTSAIVIKYDTLPFYKVFAIIHEIGHAYYHYLSRVYPSLVKSNLANECMPRIFEHLFLEYLRNNYLVDKESLDKYERIFLLHQLNITNSVYILNELLLNDKIKVDFPVERMKANLSFDEYYDLSIIKPKTDVNQEYLAYNFNYYAYAYLLSMVIKERFNKDELETRKFIKDFPVYARELTATQLINLFDKSEYINLTNKNTSRVLSKNYYKK